MNVGNNSTERTLWRETRKHINECETRKAELQLEEQHQRNLIKKYTEEIEDLKKSVEQERSMRSALEAKAERAKIEVKELHQMLSTTRDDVVMLHARVDEMQKQLDASLKAEEQEKDFFAQQLMEQVAFEKAWEKDAVTEPNATGT